MIGFRKGETEYCISWIPLGGYVKMAGEKPEEEDIQGRPYEFMSKPIWQRALVIFAGPAMNYVLTVFLLFAIYFFQGEPIDDPSAKIGLVVAGEPAAAAGLQPGDMIIGVDDSTVATFNDMYRLITNRPGEQVNLSWL